MELGSLIGTALATMAATWATFVQRLEKKVGAERDRSSTLEAKLEQLEQRLNEHDKATAKLGANVENNTKNHDELKARYEETQREVRHMVTDDEFAAYTRQTTLSVNGLTERIGRIMGALDASNG